MLLSKMPKDILGHPVETDFKKWMRFGQMWMSDLMESEKIYLSCINILGEVPEDLETWLRAIFLFYACGETTKGKPARERLLDWRVDSPAIWADFRVYVGIDLDQTSMHWWEFMALFRSLPRDARIKQIIADRSIDLSRIKDPDLRAEYAERKRMVSLEDPEEDWD